MEAVTASQKNAGPVQVLHRTGAGIEVLNAEQINVIVQFSSFPERCGACGNPLNHEDLIGKFKGTIFIVLGYVCPACNHKVGKVFMKNHRESTVRFNWERLEICRLGSVDGRGRE